MVLYRTSVVLYVVVYVVICQTTRGHLPDFHSHLRGHLPDYTWSSTGLPWSSMWSFDGLRVVIYWTSVVLYVVICQTTRGHLADLRGSLHGHLETPWSSAGLFLPSLFGTAIRY